MDSIAESDPLTTSAVAADDLHAPVDDLSREPPITADGRSERRYVTYRKN